MSHEAHFTHLLPFQIQSVVNTVYRPVSVHARTLRSTGEMVSEEEVRVSLEEDIGVIVVNDLPPGSGKTLVSAISGILFSTQRRDDIMKRTDLLIREQRPDSSWTTMANLPDVAPDMYLHALVIMCPRRLVCQWKSTFEWVMSVTGETFDIHVNPVSSLNPRSLSVFIFDNATTIKRCGIKFVPCIIVDEYLMKYPHNIVSREWGTVPVFGRMTLVSSNAGSTASFFGGSSYKSHVRRMMGLMSDERSTTSSETKRGLATLTMSTLSR